MRCSTVFSPPTTSVWPALLPPWKRTTMSASLGEQVDDLALALVAPLGADDDEGLRSRHGIAAQSWTSCAEMIAGRAPQLGEHRRAAPARRRGRTRSLAPLSSRPSSRPAMLMPCCAEQRADPPDHARDVAVVEHQDVPLGHRLHVEVVDPHDAQGLPAEDGSRRPSVVSASRVTRTVIEFRKSVGTLDARLDHAMPRSRATPARSRSSRPIHHRRQQAPQHRDGDRP